MTWELTAFTWLCTLCHLDLKVVGIDEVFARNAKAAGCNLLDCRTSRIAVGKRDETLGVFATFARVRFATQAIHGDRKILVCLSRDRAVGHRSGGEALHDFRDRFDLVDRHGRACTSTELEKTAQRSEVL
ncbi:unannotated protein [freshwater metagenome]|uniref:Unannotated protein n=1 Tax=freshwater metagenome TaxID=449393 RepID=A0A6J6HA38_9ZZZZ